MVEQITDGFKNMISWVDNNEFVWLGRVLTGYNLGFLKLSKFTNYSLPINYKEIGTELVESGADLVWIPFKWPIFTVLQSITQASKFKVFFKQFKIFIMLIYLFLVDNILFLDGSKFWG